MTLAHSDGTPSTSSGYASALDLGNAPSGGGADSPPPTDPVAPASTTAPAEKVTDKTTAGDLENLREDIVIALLDARGPITLDDIQETIASTRQAPRVRLGVIEAHLIDMETAKKVRKIGAGWELTPEARGEYETPAKIVTRRAEVVTALALMTMPGDNDFAKLTGQNIAEIQVFLRGDDSDRISGALTSDGFKPRFFPTDVLAADLTALCSIGVLKTRSARNEEDARAGEFGFLDYENAAPVAEHEVVTDPLTTDGDEDAPPSGDVDPSGTVEQIEKGTEPLDEEESEDEQQPETDGGTPDPNPTADPATTVYVFAPGQMARLLEVGAVNLVRPSVPNAAPEVVAAANESATTGDRTRFEEAAAQKSNAFLARATHAEANLLKVRTLLAQKRLEHLVDEAMGPPSPPEDPAIKFYEFTQTVKMNDAEKAVILDEIGDIDGEIAEEENRIEGAKLAASSAKTTGKEKLAELREKRTVLMGAKDMSERTYGVVAYSMLIPEGDAESDGNAVNLVLAKDGNRVLKREVLTPRAAAKAAFEAPKAKPNDPQLSLSSALEQAAVALATNPDGTVNRAADGTPVVVVNTDTPAAPTSIGKTFDVTLTEAGPNKLQVVKLVKDIAGLSSMKFAAALVDNAPKLVKGGLSMEEAEDIETQLRAVKAVTTTTLSVVAPPDAAEEAAKLAETNKATRAAAIQPKGKIALTPEGIRPFVHAAIITAGPTGILRDELVAPVCASTGFDPSSSMGALITIAVGKLLKDESALVSEAEKRLTFDMKGAVLAIVAEAGDTGVRDVDLGDAFAAKFKVTATDAILTAIVKGVEAGVEGEDLSTGPLPGKGKGNVIWISGQVDPRRGAESKGPAAEPEAPKGARGKAKAEPTAKAKKK